MPVHDPRGDDDVRARPYFHVAQAIRSNCVPAQKWDWRIRPHCLLDHHPGEHELRHIRGSRHMTVEHGIDLAGEAVIRPREFSQQE